jgi:serine/threonine-protein kinase
MEDVSIAHYRVTGTLGKGGMGEVYRATDTKLNREVALKVLPDAFAKDRERMARFGREAQVLASLNHPNIASIHGLEESEGKRALVMELVEGETLAERLTRGPIPLGEALAIARQVAEALEEAHERGIVHRDLKPANVKVTPKGIVKVLDFGLAKALEGESGSMSSPDLSRSPTMSAMATHAGVILGTAGYMSPEQARGQKVDRRSDIWAFGVLLFEMLTGSQLYTGETVSDVLAKVLERTPDWKLLPANTPASLRRLLRRALEKNVHNRLQAIGDARLVIEECLQGPSDEDLAPAAAARLETPPLWKKALPWVLLALTAAALVAALFWGRGRDANEFPVRLSVEVADKPLYTNLGSSEVLSPDGRQLLTIAGDENQRELRLRALDQLESTSLVSGSGTGSPYNPFTSPDGKWVGYVTSNELRKIAVSGGTSLTLTKVSRSRGASWGPDDTIVIAPGPTSGLVLVPAAGGEPQPLTTLDEAKGEATHRWPQFLPGGEAVVFTSHTQAAGAFDNAVIEAVVLSTGERKVLHRGGTYGRYVPSGHLVYVNQATLFAVPFDLEALEVEGAPAPIVQDVSWDATDGGAQFSFSDTGTLAYVKGGNAIPEYPVVWVDREGRIAQLWGQPGSYANPRLSPDGKKLSMTVLSQGNWDIWVFDLERNVSTRLTFEESAETEQVWSPDGEYIVFSSDGKGSDNLYRKRADGSGDIERLTESRAPQWANSWSSDGRFLAFVSNEELFDLWVVPLDAERKPEVFLKTPFSETAPDFSPDGRFLAYASNESGRFEVYVRPYPLAGGKWQVSEGGGGYPRWSHDGRELFYRNEEGLMLAPVEAGGGTFRAGTPRKVLEGAFRGGIAGLPLAGNIFSDYDVTRDGQRFVMFPAAEASQRGAAHAILVFHWFDELRRTFGGGN